MFKSGVLLLMLLLVALPVSAQDDDEDIDPIKLEAFIGETFDIGDLIVSYPDEWVARAGESGIEIATDADLYPLFSADAFPQVEAGDMMLNINILPDLSLLTGGAETPSDALYDIFVTGGVPEEDLIETGDFVVRGTNMAAMIVPTSFFDTEATERVYVLVALSDGDALLALAITAAGDDSFDAQIHAVVGSFDFVPEEP